MPKLKFATQWNSTTQQDEKFYPISITPGIIDTTRNQRLNATLADIEDKADSALRAIAYPEVVTIAIDPDTGIISAVIEDNSNNSE